MRGVATWARINKTDKGQKKTLSEKQNQQQTNEENQNPSNFLNKCAKEDQNWTSCDVKIQSALILEGEILKLIIIFNVLQYTSRWFLIELISTLWYPWQIINPHTRLWNRASGNKRVFVFHHGKIRCFGCDKQYWVFSQVFVCLSFWHNKVNIGRVWRWVWLHVVMQQLLTSHGFEGTCW